MLKLYLCIFLLVSSALAQSERAVLSISWLSGFCEGNGNCDPTIYQKWDHQSFVIHGLWPDKQVANTGFGNFNAALFVNPLLNDMRTYWPPKRTLANTNTELWSHQYSGRNRAGDGHGKDYAKIYYDQHTSFFKHKTPEWTSDFLQKKYFEDTIILYNSINAKKMNASTYTRAKLAARLGVTEAQMSLRCNAGSGTLIEVLVCLSIEPTQTRKVQCVGRQDRNCFNDNIVLKSWKRNDSAPVFIPWP